MDGIGGLARYGLSLPFCIFQNYLVLNIQSIPIARFMSNFAVKWRGRAYFILGGKSMSNFKDHPIRSRFLWFGQVCIAALIGIVLLLPISTAEANFFDTIKDIYNLPKDVENLQKQYEEAKKSYDETKQQVEEQKQLLEDQKNQLLAASQKALETEKRLAQQNKELQDHNDELLTRLQAMEETVSSKDKWIHRIKVTGITLVSMVVLYFVLGRLFRVVIWRRNNRRVH
jgi:hypothetical protein